MLLAARKSALAQLMMPVVEKTTQITAMIFLILIGATLFSLVFRALGGDDMVIARSRIYPAASTARCWR